MGEGEGAAEEDGVGPREPAVSCCEYDRGTALSVAICVTECHAGVGWESGDGRRILFHIPLSQSPGTGDPALMSQVRPTISAQPWQPSDGARGTGLRREMKYGGASRTLKATL